jgi:hypothetical protein
MHCGPWFRALLTKLVTGKHIIASSRNGRKSATISSAQVSVEPLAVVRLSFVADGLRKAWSGDKLTQSVASLLEALAARDSQFAPVGRNSPMSEESVERDLFDRWERVWHEGQYELISDCIQPNYIRHDEAGDRTVSRDAYAAEIAKTRQAGSTAVTVRCVRSHVRGRPSMVPLYPQVD